MVDARSHSEPHSDVAGYLLGTLEDHEMEAFLGHLDDCEACRREVDELADVAAVLGDVPEAWSLPAGLEARTLAAVEAAAIEPAPAVAAPPPAVAGPPPVDGPPPVAGPPPVDGPPPLDAPPAGKVVDLAAAARRRPRPPRRAPHGLPRRMLVAVAALVVVVAGVASLERLRSNPPATVATVRLISADGGPAHGDAVIHATPAGLSIDMTVDGLPPAPAGEFYTCWLVAGDDTVAHPDRVSVGSFVVRGHTVHAHWTTAADLSRFPHLGITLEPDNGNPSHQGPKVLVTA